MLEDFEIFFSDLTEEAQKRFLDFVNLKSADEGNYDVIPITVVNLPMDGICAECGEPFDPSMGCQERCMED